MEWPLKNTTYSLIVACNTCFYPITYEKHIINEIRNENNISIGIIVPIKNLLEKINIFYNDAFQLWKTEIYCPNCESSLSFTGSHKNDLTEKIFEKIMEFNSPNKQNVILQTHSLYRGSEIEAHFRFKQMLEI